MPLSLSGLCVCVCGLRLTLHISAFSVFLLCEKTSPVSSFQSPAGSWQVEERKRRDQRALYPGVLQSAIIFLIRFLGCSYILAENKAIIHNFI